MADDADFASKQADEMNEDALKEHQLKMADMEMVEGNYECEDCGRLIISLTKARANESVILCGECADWHKQRQKLGKMRDGYL